MFSKICYYIGGAAFIAFILSIIGGFIAMLYYDPLPFLIMFGLLFLFGCMLYFTHEGGI